MGDLGENIGWIEYSSLREPTNIEIEMEEGVKMKGRRRQLVDNGG